ncbi:hypothetical protein EC973_006063 [Apophysomyces ossiformis]|uniref:Uncharacterized protein n=1 Tax=Apophysomyces ossiformis TaxID=679940 RepID=A0A8H7BJ51_9FUNG|nr:hypothetical protein EC973_006063 [Apophysomyces ossiformis]
MTSKTESNSSTAPRKRGRPPKNAKDEKKSTITEASNEKKDHKKIKELDDKTEQKNEKSIGEPPIKRKRGRPRKHPKTEDDKKEKQIQGGPQGVKRGRGRPRKQQQQQQQQQQPSVLA